MTILNSQFDVISHDPHPNAGASLVTVLEVEGAPSPYGSLPASGTPVAGDIFVGAIVVMNTSGKAVLADQGDATTDFPCMPFITVDGDQDYDGAFVHKITCIQGGGEFQLDVGNYVTGSYSIAAWLTWGTGATDKGKFRAAASGEQIYAMVGQRGYNADNQTLHVIVPQGIQPLLP